MTSHGFGGVRILSEEPPKDLVYDVAREISLIKPIVWAHAVNKSKSRVDDEKGPYDIIFEFDELDKLCYTERKMNHDALKNSIKSIPNAPKGHDIIVDLWVIERSLHNGC